MASPTFTNRALLDGAMEQFTRHGFAKTSMSDIAKASGVSRTSLYNHFRTKEDVFRALSSRINDRVYCEVVAAIGSEGAWDERLLSIINARVSWVYELLHASEYGRELIDEKNRICGGNVLAANDQFAILIEELLNKNLGKRPENATIASLLIQSVNGVLEKAETKKDAEKRVSMLVGLFCKGLMNV
ncbi:MAG: helix-turn-helix domain-containing protein [Pseudomonadota bacterium]